MAPALDLTGEVFGKLKVERASYVLRRDRLWRCKCECGRYRDVRNSDLRGFKVVSCEPCSGRKVRHRTGG